MCTLAIYFRMFDAFPLLIGANRDEHYDRPATPPGVHGANPRILAGKDLRAGGTWLGINDYGVVAGILNRKVTGEIAAPTGTRSRGLLCLDLLARRSAADARQFVESRDESYQPFTVLFADPREAWAAYNVEREIKIARLDPGLHVFSNTVEFSAQTEKLARAYRLFSGLIGKVESSSGAPSSWVAALAQMLGDHSLGDGATDPREAICVHGDVSGTVSSSIIYYSAAERRFQSSYSPGPPCRTPFGAPESLDLR